MLVGLWLDIRHAVRRLKNHPGFAVVAVLSLGLGIGANTAIFSLIEAVMLRSLPVADADELLQVRMLGTHVGFSNPIWEELSDRQSVFSGAFSYSRWGFNLASGGEARYANGGYISGQYFETLGVNATLGRTLGAADDRHGCVGAAVLSHSFWQQEFGGSPGVLGETVSLNSHPIEIVGVAAAGFTGVDVGSEIDVFVPICAEEILNSSTSVLNDRAAPWLYVIARPKPGVSPTQATAQLNLLAPQIFEATLPGFWSTEQQEQYLRRTFATESAANGLSYLRTEYRGALVALMALVGLALIVACMNVANLLLVSNTARQREFAICAALGSGRGRLLRKSLIESLLLAGFGAAIGIAIASWGTAALVAYLNVNLDLTPNATVLAFTVGVTLLVGLLLGVVPAWRSVRTRPQSVLASGSRSIIEGRRFGMGKSLATAQVALSLLVVVCAALMLSTFGELASIDPGFKQDEVLITTVDTRNGNYEPRQRPAMFRQILQALRATPGVDAAAVSNIAPIGIARWTEDIEVEGNIAASGATIYFNQVSDQYFDTLSITMFAGRDFDGRDSPTSPRVAIINRSMSEQLFGADDPIGQRFRIIEANGLSDPLVVVGLVADSKYGNLRDPVPPTAYTAWSQNPTPSPFANFELRSTGLSPPALQAVVPSAIATIDPAISVEQAPLAAQVDATLERERLLASLSALFGTLTLVLVTIGIYGVISYDVTRRRNEIGVRVAIGADPNRVLRMVLSDVGLIIGIGLTSGLALTLVTTRFLASLLYGLTATDPTIIVIASSVLAAFIFVAAFIPARKAAHQDPMAALREE